MYVFMIVFIFCGIVPIVLFNFADNRIRGAKFTIYDYLLPIIISVFYSLLHFFSDHNPKSFENLSVDLSLIFISLLIYGLNVLIIKFKVLIKLLFSIIPIATMFYVLYFTGFVYE